jgi:hypothetical protein
MNESKSGSSTKRSSRGVFRSLVDKVHHDLTKGLTNRKIAFSILAGFLGGIFPVLGTTTIVCIIIAFVLRANHAIVQLVNWIVYPLQVILIIPLMKLGSAIISGPDIKLSFQYLIMSFESGFWCGIRVIGIAHLYGILGWVALIIPLGVLAGMVLPFIIGQIRKILNKL